MRASMGAGRRRRDRARERGRAGCAGWSCAAGGMRSHRRAGRRPRATAWAQNGTCGTVFPSQAPRSRRAFGKTPGWVFRMPKMRPESVRFQPIRAAVSVSRPRRKGCAAKGLFRFRSIQRDAPARFEARFSRKYFREFWPSHSPSAGEGLPWRRRRAFRWPSRRAMGRAASLFGGIAKSQMACVPSLRRTLLYIVKGKQLRKGRFSASASWCQEARSGGIVETHPGPCR